MKRAVLAIGVLAVFLSGCGKLKTEHVTKVIVKDLPLQDQEKMLDEYVGRSAWTRMPLDDLTERETAGEPKKKIIPIDTRIKIVDLNFAFSGAVMVEDPKRRRIVIGLDVERPLSIEKIEARLADMMWFQSPMLRHVDYIRMWGTKTARAVVNHEVFIGMSKEAVLESWGIPTTVNTNEIGDKKEEQWVYKLPLKSKYVYIIDEKVSKWED